MNDKVDDIVDLYKELSDDDKICLFIKLSKIDMCDFYDISYKKYRLQVKNYKGKFILDKPLTKSFYNKREVSRHVHNFLHDEMNLQKYDVEIEKIYDNYKDKISYRNKCYMEYAITEI